MAVFRMNGFTGAHFEVMGRHPELHVTNTTQMHLYPRFTIIPFNMMFKGVDRNGAVQFPVDTRK